MGQILIRNLDDAILSAYREAAGNNARSLEAELRDVLRRYRPRGGREVELARDRMAAIRAMTPKVRQTPSETLVREDRDGHRE